MYIIFEDKKLEKTCSDRKRLIQKFGSENGRKLIQRLEQIRAANCLGEMLQFRIGGCHLLSADRKGTCALSLEQPYRLIIEPIWETEPEDMSEVNYYEVTTIRVLEVIDYHGK